MNLGNLGKTANNGLPDGPAKEAAAKVESGKVQNAFGEQGGRDENEPLQNAGQVEANQAKAETQTEVSKAMAAADDLQNEMQAKQADESAPNDGMVQYSSKIQNHRVGRFQFEKGVLRLNREDAAKLDALIEKMPRVKQAVTKIDVAEAERISRQFQQTKRIRGIDTAGLGFQRQAPND